MCVNEAFCVTGSEDGFLRLWPLDFKHVYLEAGKHGECHCLGQFYKRSFQNIPETLVNVLMHLHKNACNILMTVKKVD